MSAPGHSLRPRHPRTAARQQAPSSTLGIHDEADQRHARRARPSCVAIAHIMLSDAVDRFPSVQRIAVGAGLFGRSAKRIPVRKRSPDRLCRRLRVVAQPPKINAGDDAILHPDLAIDNHGVDVVADAAFDHALHRIAYRPVAQRAPSARSMITMSASAPGSSRPRSSRPSEPRRPGSPPRTPRRRRRRNRCGS